MKLKRIITLGYPASRLPDDLRGKSSAAAKVNVMIEEEAGGRETTNVEWEVVVQRWVDGNLAPASMSDVPASLLESIS